MRKPTILTLLFVASAAVLVSAQPVVRTTRLSGLPTVFQGRPAGRLAAEEVARTQAWARLLERIYGMSVDARTEVRDLAFVSREVRTDIENAIRGVEELETRYYEDGRVQVTARVKIRQVVEIVESTCERVVEDGRLSRLRRTEKTQVRNRRHDLVAVGFGALPGSLGMARIRAMRAAEVDCCARLVAKVSGRRLASSGSLGNFAMTESRTEAALRAAVFKGVRFSDYEFLEDGSCRVTGGVRLREVIETTRRAGLRVPRRAGERVERIETVRRELRDRLVTAVGYGVPPAHAPQPKPFFSKTGLASN